MNLTQALKKMMKGRGVLANGRIELVRRGGWDIIGYVPARHGRKGTETPSVTFSLGLNDDGEPGIEIWGGTGRGRWNMQAEPGGRIVEVRPHGGRLRWATLTFAGGHARKRRHLDVPLYGWSVNN